MFKFNGSVLIPRRTRLIPVSGFLFLGAIAGQFIPVTTTAAAREKILKRHQVLL